MGGLCRIIAYIVGPAHILHKAVEPDIVFGPFAHNKDKHWKTLEALKDSFHKVKVQAVLTEDVK